MNMGKLCVFAILWQIWHGNTIETHASFVITCFQCFFFFFFFSGVCFQMRYKRMFCHKLGSKRRFGFFRGERGLRAKVTRTMCLADYYYRCCYMFLDGFVDLNVNRQGLEAEPDIPLQHLPIIRKAPDTFNFLRHVMRAIWSVRPKCSHRCVSLKETP